MKIRTVVLAILLLLIRCEVVKAPERPKQALPPAPEAPPEVEAAMIANCSPESHFGTKRASEVLQMPIRWVQPGSDSQVCTMGPPGDTRPYFWISVADAPGSFENFTQQADTQLARDAVNGAKRVAWSPADHKLIVADDKHLVIVTMDPKTQTQSETAERMTASNIAAKLLFSLR